MAFFQTDQDRQRHLEFFAQETVKDRGKYLRRGGGERDGEIRQATRMGRPAGGVRFVGLVERLTGRDLSVGMAARPARGKSESVLCRRNNPRNNPKERII
jgi:hypothetical protein